MLMKLIMAESESNPARKRKSESAKKLVDCVDENCSNKQKTYRVIARHYENTHSETHVLGIKCNSPACVWYCYKDLGCFVEHMKKVHGVKVTVDS